VRARIDWKYARSLELTDAGFDYSVLSEFRARLVAGGAEHVLLDRLLAHAAERGLVKARTKQRTDSTHVLAAVRTLNRLELVGESVPAASCRAALNALAATAPDWLRAVAPSEWHARYDHRFEEARMPSTDSARERLLRTLGEDGAALLAAVDAPTAPPALRSLPAVAALRQVLARTYAREPSDTEDGPAVLRPRGKGELGRAPRAVESPYEFDARYCSRPGAVWVGYMVHLSETCAPGLPRLVTHVDTTPAGVYEATRVDAIHAALAAKGLLPSEHFADGAYLSAALLVRSRREYGVRLRGPTKPTDGWQRHGGGLTVDAFRVDWRRREVTCPAGQTSSTWRTYDGAAVETGRGRDPYVKVRFAPSVCGSRRGRQLMLHPQAEQEALAAARAHHASRRGRRAYAIRSGIEGTVSQAVQALNLRRARYRGLAKTHVQAVATAAALNAARLSAWLAGRPLAPTRTSHFARLAA
jgi:hypothetical protein